MKQTQEILKYLHSHGSITPIEALQELGCFRLAARIHDIEKTGIHIPRRTVTRVGRKTGRKVTFTEYLKPEYTGDR